MPTHEPDPERPYLQVSRVAASLSAFKPACILACASSLLSLANSESCVVEPSAGQAWCCAMRAECCFDSLCSCCFKPSCACIAAVDAVYLHPNKVQCTFEYSWYLHAFRSHIESAPRKRPERLQTSFYTSGRKTKPRQSRVCILDQVMQLLEDTFAA